MGDELYEPHEENPMLGYRGASRCISPDFRACFDMECEALRFVRDEMGFTNVQVMVPFVRTVGEGIESVSLNPDTVVGTWLRLAGVDRAAAPVR